MWSTSCEDWPEKILSGRSLVPDFPLFKDEAAKALRIFKRLRIPDIHGTPTMAEACGEWVFPIVAAMFGSFDRETNARMLQEFFLLIPKGNAKTSYGGAIMVVALIMNHRPEGEFHLIAPTMQIANYAFRQAAGTIRLDPELAKLFLIQSHLRTITHRQTGATLQIKAADTDVITGGKQVGTMIDETHVFAKKANAADIFVEIRGALGKRRDGFLFQTTTQSKDQPSGVFRSELAMARAVRDGEMQLPMLPVLYELPIDLAKDGGWKDRRYWRLINPNMDRSVNMEFLERELLKAEREGAAQLVLYASQHHNVEIGLALQSDGWAGAQFWPAAADKTLTLDEVIRRSEVIVVGIDGGGLDDLLGLAVLGREKDTGRWLLWNHAWAHEIVKERRKEIASRLEDLAAVGVLTFVKLPGEDVAELADEVMKVEDAGLLPDKMAIGVDSFGVAEIGKELAKRGIDLERIEGIPQGWKLNGAIKTTERNLAGGTLIHGGSPLMDFAVANAKVVASGNAITITKQVAGSAKIDPLMATFAAVALMGFNPEAGAIYENRDIRFVA